MTADEAIDYIRSCSAMDGVMVVIVSAEDLACRGIDIPGPPNEVRDRLSKIADIMHEWYEEERFDYDLKLAALDSEGADDDE